MTVSLVLYLIFNGELLQAPYALGFLMAAWAGAKITERSEQRHIAIFNFSVDSKRFHQFRTTLFIFRSPLYIVNAILFKELLYQ